MQRSNALPPFGCQGLSNGFRLHRSHHRIFRDFGRIDPILRESDGQGRQVMSWAYWVSGVAAIIIFVYLVVALFKPELFE